MTELMGRCRDCKWWDPPFTDDDTKYGICELAISDSDESMMRAFAPSSDVETKPDFGCVQFEAKP